MMIRHATPVLLDSVRGDDSGLTIPAHADALRVAGPEFLTESFRKFGSLSTTPGSGASLPASCSVDCWTGAGFGR
jgi:hypothetical protein